MFNDSDIVSLDSFIVAFCKQAASDPAAGWGGGGGSRNMKSMWPPLAAIFFMTYLYRAVGGHGPLGTPLPGSATDSSRFWGRRRVDTFLSLMSQELFRETEELGARINSPNL